MASTPTDPRTPLQAAEDRLNAARTELVEGHPSRTQRQELSDQIRDLTQTVKQLKQPQA